MLPRRKDLYNIPGWHTRRRLVVIESDDWGSIRTPSTEAYNTLLSQGIRVDRDPYCRYDSLATPGDLSNLFEVLHAVKDSNGNPAVLTANCVTANPLFEKIEQSGYNEYFFEPFPDTLQRDALHSGSFALWKEGMAMGVFHPQLHGREHLNVQKWLRALRSAEAATLAAFKVGSFGLTQIAAPTVKEYYMGAFNSSLPADTARYAAIIKEGADMFQQLFNYRSESFIATTYEWHPDLEPHLSAAGVKYLQGTVCQKIPIGNDEGVTMHRRCFQGRRSSHGLIYLMRNCLFEPSLRPTVDSVDQCLQHIRTAFRWGKAANICTHRVNFIGSIDHRNTDRTLPAFRTLLQEITKRWPDCEFVTSDQLGRIIQGKSL